MAWTETHLDRRQVLKGAGVLGAATATALVPSAASADQHRGGLVGAWRADSPATATFPPFGMLMMFAPGGGMVISTSLDLTPDFLSTPGYGSWTNSGERSYRAAFVFFGFDAKGKPSGTYDVRALFHLDQDAERLQGSFVVDVVDTKGNKVLTDSGTLQGGRVQAERT